MTDTDVGHVEENDEEEDATVGNNENDATTPTTTHATSDVTEEDQRRVDRLTLDELRNVLWLTLGAYQTAQWQLEDRYELLGHMEKKLNDTSTDLDWHMERHFCEREKLIRQITQKDSNWQVMNRILESKDEELVKLNQQLECKDRELQELMMISTDISHVKEKDEEEDDAIIGNNENDDENDNNSDDNSTGSSSSTDIGNSTDSSSTDSSRSTMMIAMTAAWAAAALRTSATAPTVIHGSIDSSKYNATTPKPHAASDITDQDQHRVYRLTSDELRNILRLTLGAYRTARWQLQDQDEQLRCMEQKWHEVTSDLDFHNQSHSIGVFELNRQIKRKDSDLKKIYQILESRDKELVKLNQQLECKDRELEELNRQLKEVNL